MGQFVRFFDRQVLIGGDSSSGEYRSDVFDVSDMKEITGHLEVYVASGSAAQVTGTIEHTDNPSMDDSVTLGSVGQSGVGTGQFGGNPRRFVRGKLSVQNGQVVSVHFHGRAYD